MDILCAVDESLHARWSLEVIQELCSLSDSRLIVLNVVEYGIPFPTKGLEALELPEDKSEALFLRLQREVVSSSWRNVRCEVLRGRPVADMILRTASQTKVDLIVIGGHGLPDLVYFLTGSVSRRVAMHASCSVLIVKKLFRKPARVTIGVDGSDAAREAVEFLLRLPLSREVSVNVVGVVPPLPFVRKDASTTEAGVLLVKEAERTVGETSDRLRERGYDAKAVVRHGHPSHELVSFAEATRSDFLVVGFEGLTGDRERTMGSVAESVMLYATCSVLVCR
jgi:nucleotide-binding universal stress UspA family protein